MAGGCALCGMRSACLSGWSKTQRRGRSPARRRIPEHGGGRLLGDGLHTSRGFRSCFPGVGSDRLRCWDDLAHVAELYVGVDETQDGARTLHPPRITSLDKQAAVVAGSFPVDVRRRF